MLRAFTSMFACGALLLVGSPAQGTTARPEMGQSNTASCDLATASSWINRWFAAWELTSKEILHLPDAAPPTVVFYDSSCVYTTSDVTVAARPVDHGPLLRGAKLPWRTALHRDSLTLPDASRVPVQLMSFANSDRRTGPFFVMAAPPYWAQRGARGPGSPRSSFTNSRTRVRSRAWRRRVRDARRHIPLARGRRPVGGSRVARASGGWRTDPHRRQ